MKTSLVYTPKRNAPSRRSYASFKRARGALMQRLFNRPARPFNWIRLLLVAAVLAQLAFAVVGPFSGDFATAWSTPAAETR
jgi:hypothetical protein